MKVCAILEVQFVVLISQTGTKATPAEQLSMALAWDRADIAQKEILVAGQHWQVRSSRQQPGLLKEMHKKMIRVLSLVKLADT